jgi:hypothetical protein
VIDRSPTNDPPWDRGCSVAVTFGLHLHRYT